MKARIEAMDRAGETGELVFGRAVMCGGKCTPAAPADHPGAVVAYVNRDELDNMLDDRTAVIQGKPSGFRNTALYLAAPSVPSAPAAPGGAIDAREPKPAICGVLAGEPEVIGERCKDGGKCHHACATVCFRREGNNCVPLTGSRLNDDWSEPASNAQDERDVFEAWYVKDAKRHGFKNMTVESVKSLREGEHYGAHRHMLNGKWEGWQAAKGLL